MQALVRKGMDVDAVDSMGNLPIAWALRAKDDRFLSQREACALFLLEAGATWRGLVPTGSPHKSTVLRVAAAARCVRVMMWLLRRMRAEGMDRGRLLGAMEDAAGGAVYAGALVSLRALAEKGVDVKSARVTVIDGAGRSISIALLNRTAERGHKDIVEFLVEQGCDPLAIADSTGLMPHHSAYRGHVAILE